MEITDKQQYQHLDSQEFSKLQKEEYLISQTERYGPSSTQRRLMLLQQQQQQQQSFPTSVGTIIEDKTEKYQHPAATITSSGTIVQNNNTQSFSSTNSTNQTIELNPSENSAIKKKIMFQRPIPFKSLKRAESTNENFFVGSSDKNHTSGIGQLSKMGGTLTHFGLNGKLCKSNPLDLLKNMQKQQPMALKLTSTQSCNMQNPLQTANSQIASTNSHLTYNQALKYKNSCEFNKPMANQQTQNIEKVQYSPKRDDTSIENSQKRQSTENTTSNPNNNSFQIDELPFKQRNLIKKTALLTSSTQAAGFNLLNQSPPLQIQQLAQQQQLQNQATFNNKKNVTLTNFHQVTQVGLSAVSPSNYHQQNTITPKQQQINQQITSNISGSSLSFPFGQITENAAKPFQKNPYSQSAITPSIYSQSTNSLSLNSPQLNIKNESASKIAFRFSLKKTNSSNIANAFSSSQQNQLQQLKKSVSADQENQQQQQIQEKQEKYNRNEIQPFELPEQEEISSCEDLAAEECASPSSFNIEFNKNEKSRTFYISNNQCSTKNGSNNNTITSFYDQQSQNTLGSTMTSNKLQQNQLKRKINEAKCKATYYSTNFEKQKLFEQQNEEEEVNFRELCQVFSIM